LCFIFNVTHKRKKNKSQTRVSNSGQGAGTEFETRVWLCAEKMKVIWPLFYIFFLFTKIKNL
jgi:hypothetical protein